MQITTNLETKSAKVDRYVASLTFAFGIKEESVPFSKSYGVSIKETENIKDLIRTRAQEIVTNLGFGKDLLIKSCTEDENRNISLKFEVKDTDTIVEVNL